MVEKVLSNRIQCIIVQVLGQFGQPLQSFIGLLISTEMVLLGQIHALYNRLSKYLSFFDSLSYHDAKDIVVFFIFIKASGTSVSGIISGLIKLFGYLLFVTAALNVFQLSIIADLVGRIVEYLPNLAAGILILIGGLLVIGVFEKYLDNFMKGMSIESANVLLPMLREVLLLLVIFIALDTMLVDIGVFYVILQPLAWGVAVIIAFKYGIKDAIVAYAKERKQEG